jgi:hypothetical protein
MERLACPNYCILYCGDTFKDFGQISCMFCKLIQNNTGYCGGVNQDPGDGNKRKRKGATNSVPSIETTDTTLGISEK